MRVRVDHHLRHAGRAGGQQVLGVRLRGDRFEGGAHGRRLAARRQRREAFGAGQRVGVRACEHRRASVPVAAMAAPYTLASAAYTSAGRSAARIDAQLAMVLRHAAVRRRHRAHRAADVHGGQRQQRVVDAVVRQDDHRSAVGQAAVEQPLREPADLLARLAVAQAAPAAAGVALGQERRVGCFTRPALEPFADGARRCAQRLARAQHERAAAELDALDARAGQRPRFIVQGHLVACHIEMGAEGRARRGAMQGAKHSDAQWHREHSQRRSAPRIARTAASDFSVTGH